MNEREVSIESTTTVPAHDSQGAPTGEYVTLVRPKSLPRVLDDLARVGIDVSQPFTTRFDSVRKVFIVSQ